MSENDIKRVIIEAIRRGDVEVVGALTGGRLTGEEIERAQAAKADALKLIDDNPDLNPTAKNMAKRMYDALGAAFLGTVMKLIEAGADPADMQKLAPAAIAAFVKSNTYALDALDRIIARSQSMDAQDVASAADEMERAAFNIRNPGRLKDGDKPPMN